jgi:hypothetical protein
MDIKALAGNRTGLFASRHRLDQLTTIAYAVWGVLYPQDLSISGHRN